MKEVFNRTTNSIIVSSVLTLILGILMIAFPKISIETIGMIAAIYIILYGILLIFLDIQASRLYVPFEGLLSGIISILIGTFLLCRPSVIPTVFTFIIGIWVILSSINYIRIALKLTKTDLPWLLVLLLGILDLIAGVVIVLYPFESSISIALIAGIALIVHSIITIVDTIILKRDVKEISKELEKYLEEASKEAQAASKAK